MVPPNQKTVLLHPPASDTTLGEPMSGPVAVVRVVVSLGLGQTPAEKGTGVQFIFLGAPLGKDGGLCSV